MATKRVARILFIYPIVEVGSPGDEARLALKLNRLQADSFYFFAR